MTPEATAILGDLVGVTEVFAVDLPVAHWPPPKPITAMGGARP